MNAGSVIALAQAFTDRRMPPEVWRLVEHRLRNYDEYQRIVASYEKERELLAEPNITASVNEAVQHGYGRPTELQAIRLEALARTADDASWCIRCIEDVLRGLHDIEREMIDEMYFKNHPVLDVARGLGMSEPTLRRMRRPVIESFARRMGLW